MMPVIVPVKKEYVPEPRAKDTSKTAVEPHIQNMRMPAAILLGKKIGDASGKDNAETENESVGADRKVANKKQILMQGQSSCNHFLEVIIKQSGKKKKREEKALGKCCLRKSKESFSITGLLQKQKKAENLLTDCKVFLNKELRYCEMLGTIRTMSIYSEEKSLGTERIRI